MCIVVHATAVARPTTRPWLHRLSWPVPVMASRLPRLRLPPSPREYTRRRQAAKFLSGVERVDTCIQRLRGCHNHAQAYVARIVPCQLRCSCRILDRSTPRCSIQPIENGSTSVANARYRTSIKRRRFLRRTYQDTTPLRPLRVIWGSDDNSCSDEPIAKLC